MEAIIKKIYNEKNQEIGAILTAKVQSNTDILTRNLYDYQLQSYAFTQLYPRQVLNFYHEIHYDYPSIVVIRNINDLPYEEKEIKF